MASIPLRVPLTLARWWQAKPPRERRIVAALGMVVLAALAWLVLWQPLQRDLVVARTAAATERLRLAAAQRMAGEIASLAREPAKPAAPDARAPLERALSMASRKGDAQVEWQEGRARAVLAAADFNALVAALETVQRDTGLRIVEATFTAHVDPGVVRAELTLAR